jgi:hypothetical protein
MNFVCGNDLEICGKADFSTKGGFFYGGYRKF